jgi:hypothetical protein
VNETPLAGGDVNLVVRVGDTVRRPPEPAEVQALLRWYEHAGFDGAPRFIGIDDQGREALSFVEGEPAFAPVPSSDEVVAAIGTLLRRAHDAQSGFARPRAWAGGEVIAHNDLFWTNVIFRDGLPAALIDWELAGPSTRALDIAKAATYWAGVRIDEQLDEWGIPLERRGERLRILCDGYGLTRTERLGMLEELIAWRRIRLAERRWRGVTPRHIIEANLRWTEDHAGELGTFLS